MRVVTVYAHPDPRSFCHAVMQRFTSGLRDAAHEVEVIDLYGHAYRGRIGQRLVSLVHERVHGNDRAQWEKVAVADGLAFVAPVGRLPFPAILEGWARRVFAHGAVHPDRALLISTTLSLEEHYRPEWQQPVPAIAGLGNVERAYFYEVRIAGRPQLQEYLRRAYLRRAYELGVDFIRVGETARTQSSLHAAR